MADLNSSQKDIVLSQVRPYADLLPLYRISFFDGPFQVNQSQFFLGEDCNDTGFDPGEQFRGVNLSGFPFHNFQKPIQNVHGKQQTYRQAEEELLNQAVLFAVREKVRQFSSWGKNYALRNATGLTLMPKALGVLEILAQETRSVVNGPNSTGVLPAYTQEAINSARFALMGF